MFAVVLTGFVTTASSTGGVFDTLAAGSTSHATTPAAAATAGQAALIPTVGLVPAAPRPERQLRSAKSVAASDGPSPSRAEPHAVPVPVVVGPLGIPEIVLNAYRAAEQAATSTQPGCGLPWNLLAGIGKIESGHAGGGRTDAAGTTVTPILGPTLDGHLAGNEIITDTDLGVLDGDPVHDRAVGPMQFIPSTWARYASDGNDDGVADPNNVFDASLSAARYLCSGGLDLRDPEQQSRAVLRYNNSTAYRANVLAWSEAYAAGTAAPAEPMTPSPPERLADAVDVAATIPAPTTSPAAPDAAPSPAPIPAPMPFPVIPGLPIPGLPQLPCLIFCPPPAPAPDAGPTP
ncbi:lytic transglycosylase domain-containing protein [Rhodococcus spongiicola]|nr:lytic murein transglycosylase [Rhodococcus spongiicola]